MASCGNSKQDETAIYQRDSLLGVIENGETAVNEFITYFNEVERNLDSVATHQHVILLNSKGPLDVKKHQKEKIIAEIIAINRLMDANSKKMKTLSSKLNASSKKNMELEKSVTILNKQLTMKYIELMNLNETLKERDQELMEYKIIVDTLLLKNAQLAQNLENKTGELRTAYYIVGTSVDLQQWNLVDKQGGFLGIGQISKLSNNLDMNMFTKIDYLETTTIPINSKGVRIVTTHPTGSFTLNKKGRTVESITITDPELFWSASKYLVITL